MTVSVEQKTALIRAAGLIGRYAEGLAAFEVELVRDCVERYRDRGDRMTLTANEWRVVSDAIAAMDKAKAAHQCTVAGLAGAV